MTTPNRTNSDFQIAYFLAGSCHTPDGAYAMLCNLQDDRKLALFEADKKIEKHKASKEFPSLLFVKNYNAAVKELATIEKCIAIVQPLRKYKDLPDDEAHEMSQAEEWKLELISRAENQLITTGTISHDQFATMRLHPDFTTDIWPAISKAKSLIESEKVDVLIEVNNKRLFKLEFKK